MAEHGSNGSNGRVLIAEDSEVLRMQLERAAALAGHDVVAVGDGADALRQLCQRPVDVILADHFMPKMNGLHLLRVARLAWPQTARILMTAHADHDLTVAAINSGQVHRFLTKPVDAPRLGVLLRDVLTMTHPELLRSERRRAA